jgi:2-dehydro-3-deoxyphosphooctonate aldolase (KDO 8-P synthase)
MKDKLLLIAGPCVLEDKNTCRTIARHCIDLCKSLDIDYVFKASYQKANRTSLHAFTGLDREKALNILAEIKSEFGVPVLTDIHEASEAGLVAKYVDILQIPAFLCRQTSLLLAAGETGKVVNIKKGQFLSGESMTFAAEKVVSTGNENIWITERGTTFGYSDLVVDFRNIPIMKDMGYPVIIDATHSVQRPNQTTGETGGDPNMINTIAKCGIAAGSDGVFMEVHPDPSSAKSDRGSMLKLDELESVLSELSNLWNAINK